MCFHSFLRLFLMGQKIEMKIQPGWLCIEGSLVSHFFQTGVIEMHLGRHVSAAQSQSGVTKLPALYELCCVHAYGAAHVFAQKHSGGCAYPCMCVKSTLSNGICSQT